MAALVALPRQHINCIFLLSLDQEALKDKNEVPNYMNTFISDPCLFFPVMSPRFQKLLLFLGMNATAAQELKVTDFCSIVSEFALEYRTIRERHIEIEKKKEDHKKRNKTRGKMITEVKTVFIHSCLLG